ncbi:helix-turn-helix transcriptional regulator [Leucobacter tenebrionis]|uniref:helix-turn-helix transcriptional regulator n=1 Tax=Leucobacter tenebrionis TaxID=2873270 RepID=UPI001CA5FDFF|nr:response regulator transcription factor [Leucobacter tenebrionis]QZY51959.1 response regulator transcription factor [Leucobacter tenebrionis]
MSKEPLRLRLLNDYEVVVAGLAAMLRPFESRVKVVEEDVRGVSDRRVDITLYDTFGRSRPRQGELEELAADPHVGTLVIYAWAGTDLAEEAPWAAQGFAYLDKSLPAAELVSGLERIAGRREAERRPADAVPRLAEPQTSWPGKQEGLSVREAEVVALIVQGHTNTEIAASLFLSPNSLKSYIRSAYRKMGVERRAQAVKWGMEHGMRRSTGA